MLSNLLGRKLTYIEECILIVSSTLSDVIQNIDDQIEWNNSTKIILVKYFDSRLIIYFFVLKNCAHPLTPVQSITSESSLHNVSSSIYHPNR